jgi:hypothetical protein
MLKRIILIKRKGRKGLKRLSIGKMKEKKRELMKRVEIPCSNRQIITRQVDANREKRR